MKKVCLSIILISLLILSACNETLIPPVSVTPTRKPLETATITSDTFYVVDGIYGSDTNPGSLAQPWQSIQKAAGSVVAGDTIYIRGGEYPISESISFATSGSSIKPITLSNYPGEQVVIKITNSHQPFSCWYGANYIHIIGSDVEPFTLSNGVVSQKGIVVQGRVGEQTYAIVAWGCDYWEVAGIDFIDTAAGIRTFKDNSHQKLDNSADYWHVHDNRVYSFFRESGLQFNGDYNIIANNEIYKVSSRLDTPYGCQHLNILGHHNTIRGNVISRLGSNDLCSGILLEWDLSDMNIIEQNLIYDVPSGIDIAGGDNNSVRNNVIYVTDLPEPYTGGINIISYDNYYEWPCDEESSSAQILLPENDPSDPDYPYYYNPRNCHSFGNEILNNTIFGFEEGIRLYPVIGENTVIRNNVLAGWFRGAICYYSSGNGTCKPLPTNGVIVESNAIEEPFGFRDLGTYDFHLSANSPLIDTGYDLLELNLKDFEGISRPQGLGYDIGAYEYLP